MAIATFWDPHGPFLLSRSQRVIVVDDPIMPQKCDLVEAIGREVYYDRNELGLPIFNILML